MKLSSADRACDLCTVWAAPAPPASAFYYNRTSLTSSVFEAGRRLRRLARRLACGIRQRHLCLPAQQLDSTRLLQRALA